MPWASTSTAAPRETAWLIELLAAPLCACSQRVGDRLDDAAVHVRRRLDAEPRKHGWRKIHDACPLQHRAPSDAWPDHHGERIGPVITGVIRDYLISTVRSSYSARCGGRHLCGHSRLGVPANDDVRHVDATRAVKH